MQVEVTQIEALEDRAQYAERRLRHCKQWYAERLERLTAYAKENGIWPDVACIIANGSLSDGTRYDPPTYAQQMNTAIHRAEAAEDRASKLQGTVDTLEAQIAELRSALEKARDQFQFYADEHKAKSDAAYKAWDDARYWGSVDEQNAAHKEYHKRLTQTQTNCQFVEMITAALQHKEPQG